MGKLWRGRVSRGFSGAYLSLREFWRIQGSLRELRGVLDGFGSQGEFEEFGGIWVSLRKFGGVLGVRGE